MKSNKLRYIKHIEKIKLIHETPEIYWSKETQEYVNSDVSNPSKQWVHDIICEQKEQDCVRHRDKDFVLLPDIKNIYRRCLYMHRSMLHFNWMGIVTDPSLRSIRDLRRQHIPLLKHIKATGIECIRKEFPQVKTEDIMVYANYPPSVHVLHFHFCFPFFHASAYDAFRVHAIDHIINNLEVNADYYSMSTFVVPVHETSPLIKIYGATCYSEDSSSESSVESVDDISITD